MTPKSFEPARPGNLLQALSDGPTRKSGSGASRSASRTSDGTGRIHRLMLAVQRAAKIHVLSMNPDEIEGARMNGKRSETRCRI